MVTANDVVELAISCVGIKEGSKEHRNIIDVYNTHTPLPRGYKMQYSVAWCATFISYLAVKLGITNIIPPECSCGKMIDLFKGIGSWVEDENRVPNIGDIVFYDWDDSGSGNNAGWPEHVGIVSKVSGNTFEVVEGNKSNAVGIRSMKVNGKNLRGFGVPKYGSESTTKNEGNSSYLTYTVKSGDNLTKIAKNFGTTVSEIVSANSELIENPSSIKVGWVLKIPSEKEVILNPEVSVKPVETNKNVKDLFNAFCDDLEKLESFQNLKRVLEGE